MVAVLAFSRSQVILGWECENARTLECENARMRERENARMQYQKSISEFLVSCCVFSLLTLVWRCRPIILRGLVTVPRSSRVRVLWKSRDNISLVWAYVISGFSKYVSCRRDQSGYWNNYYWQCLQSCLCYLTEGGGCLWMVLNLSK